MSSVRRAAVIFALASAACSDRPLPYRPPPPQPIRPMPSPQPRPEQCNGIDDDLDGRVDEGCPIRLTTDAADDLSPEIKGNRVAWLRRGALYLKELPDGPERKIVDGVGANFAFDGHRVVTLAGAHFVLVDVDTQEETVITPTNLYGELGVPSFAGNRVVWQQHIPQSWAWDESEDIYAYDLDTRMLTAVTDSHVMRTDALGDGAQVVWGDGTRFHDWINYNSYYDIYAADLTQGPSGRALAVGGDAISTVPIALGKGRVLAYEEQLYGGDTGWILGSTTCQLLLYDVATGQRTELEPVQPVDGTQCDATQQGFTALTFDSDKPEAFDGERVVRELHPLDESDLYLYDVAKNAHYRLTDHPRRSQHPRFDGNILVWQDDRNDQFDIYMMDMTDVAAGEVFPNGNPRNGDCDGGDTGGCVARVGRAWGNPALHVVDSRIVYSGHDGVTRFDIDTRQAQTLAPILDPDFTKRHQPQYVEVATDGDGVAYVRADQMPGNNGPTIHHSLYFQRHAGAAVALLDDTGGYSVALDHGRAAWLVTDGTKKTTSLQLNDDTHGTSTIVLSHDPMVTLANLSLSGDWAVYQQETSTGTAPDPIVLVAFNVRTMETRHPAAGLPSGGQDVAPQIDGSTIVWSHVASPATYGAVQARVYAYDLTTGMRAAISPLMAAPSTALAVSGARICWDDASGVWLSNLASGQMKLMSSRGRGCAVSGSVIAFYEGSDVYERRIESNDP
jgi:beta propeller repeat protein